KQCLPARTREGVPVLSDADPRATVRAQQRLMGEINPATGWTEWPGGPLLVSEREPEKGRAKLPKDASRGDLIDLATPPPHAPRPPAGRRRPPRPRSHPCGRQIAGPMGRRPAR